MLTQDCNSDYLEIFHELFNEISNNVSSDCSKIISKILKSHGGLNPNGTENFSEVNFRQAFSSIKVLLKLFEKLCSSNIKHNTRLPFDHILQNIHYVVGNPGEIDNNFQQDVLTVVHSLFKIGFSQGLPDNIYQLAEFYQYNLNCIHASTIPDDLSSDNLIFRLKIVSVMYKVASGMSDSDPSHQNVVSFCENLTKLKMMQNLDECKVFSDLVLYGVDVVAIETLLHLIPQYVNCYKSGAILEIIWKEISKLLTCQKSSVKYSRVLLIMCYFFHMSFEETAFKGDEKLIKLLFNDVNYWHLIQSCLVEPDPMMRKQAMYLFKKTIDILNIKNMYIKSLITNVHRMNDSDEKMIFLWDTNLKEELNNIYTEIIVVLEYFDEQQTHIIKPIFQMLDKLVQKFTDIHEKGKNLDLSWIIMVHEKALMHESTQVVKWGLNNLLKLPVKFFSDDRAAIKVVELLLVTLNNMSIYYNDGLAISKEVTVFCQKMTKSKTSGVFFSLFIKKICNLVWSPEALFFVIHSLSAIHKYSYWGEEEISEIKKFVSKAFKTHNKIIRSAVQCELLNSVMGLTDEKNVSLEKIILLLASFSTKESLKRDSQIWDRVLKWLRNAYSPHDTGRVLEKFESGILEKEFNERSIALMFIFFYYAFIEDITDMKHFGSNVTVVKKLSEMLLTFKGINQRLYYDKSLLDHYVSITCHICEESLNHSKPEPLLKFMLPFLTDILCYIVRELKLIWNLQDFSACQAYIKAFETIMKTQILYEVNSAGLINDLLLDIINNLKSSQILNSEVPPMQIYSGMKLLRVIDKISYNYVKPCASDFLISYLLKEANESLRKDDNSEYTKDVQTLWGRMNSEFLEAKWQILEHFISNNLIMYESENVGKTNTSIPERDLVQLCVEALNIGGYGVLCPVMSILRNLLCRTYDSEVESIITSIWRLIMERRKTDEFKLFIKKFVQMLFQEKFILKGSSAQETLIECADLIFSDSSLGVVNVLLKHVQEMEITHSSVPLLSHVIAKGLIFGPVQKKDERLTVQICSYISSFGICPVSEYNTSNEIRARALQKILNLDKNSPTHRLFVRNLMETLLKMENDTNKNKTRYFGDSQVHRIKHRLMQALLLLEPLFYPDQAKAEDLSRWLYRNLMTENPQPSVKYQQEWLLIRLLIRYPSLLSNFWDYFSDSVEKKTKGVCTLIAIAHHLCKLVPPQLTASWIDQAIPTFLPFCMDQHFEVRLYAQVVLQKLYELAITRELSEVVKKYETVHQCVLKSIERGCKGNAGKNCEKLQKDFYLNIFHPLEHYSLQTIFMDLPRLANVGSDEWISADVFESCGVDSAEISILLKIPDSPLEKIDGAKWLVERSHPGVVSEFDEEKSDEYLGNYQKKIIPVKALVPGLRETPSCNGANETDKSVKRDGLVVVASLIDRLPNLGGLARTCEVFGASEYVLNSLKYIEDKQFTSLSVTAEKWITIKEVKTQNLLDYVIEMKQLGYTVIGAEQALYSQPLSSVKFPKKSLLLLGNEKEGIPPNLLPLLDICVEIPQVGIIRSLNVHVTGALFIWEYAKQN